MLAALQVQMCWTVAPLESGVLRSQILASTFAWPKTVLAPPLAKPGSQCKVTAAYVVHCAVFKICIFFSFHNYNLCFSSTKDR